MLADPMTRAAITIREATDRDLPVVVDLACATFRAHYPSIIGRDQIEYMLATTYSIEALGRQRKEGHVFLVGSVGGTPVAFASFGVSAEDQVEGQIHKLCVLPDHQRHGIGHGLIEHISERLARMGRTRLVLAINRCNISAINFSFKNGFTIRSAVDSDIGGGFAMSDFVMTRKLRDTPGSSGSAVLPVMR
jgi:ribosomal protein S18 acetylase RimI-like enzyme